MNEDLIFTLVGYNFLVIFILLVIKLILFALLDSRKKTFKTFLYFSEKNLYATKDAKKKRQKKIQNVLSIIIILLLLGQVFIFMSGVFFKRKIEE